MERRSYWLRHPHEQDSWAPRGCDPGGFFVLGAIVNQAVFLVDGFNVYHSVREAEPRAARPLRWLDLAGLCRSLLHALPDRSCVQGVVYFSALAHHMESSRPGTVARHLRYLDALHATEVETRLGHFKRRETRCPLCGRVWYRWEEKETDVAIASRLLRLAATAECEHVVIVSGDTDLIPAIQEARLLRKLATIGVVFPARRANAQLRQEADWSIRLDADWYRRHQLPESILGAGGEDDCPPARVMAYCAQLPSWRQSR